MTDTETVRHPDISDELPGVLLEEETTGYIATLETETTDINPIITTYDTKSGIINTPGVWYDNGDPNPIDTPRKPTTDTHANE